MNSRGQVNRDNSDNRMDIVQVGSVRYAQVQQFLSDKERDELVCRMHAHKDSFTPPGIPGHYQPVGSSLYFSPEHDKTWRDTSPVDRVCDVLSQRILEQLPTLCDALDVEHFPVQKPSITLMSGGNGHLSLPHIDRYDDSIKITVLYYIHSSPKAYQGGDLELFESDASLSFGYKEQAVTSINHQDNILLAFTSDTYHGVTEVCNGSGQFEDSRFVAVSFLGPQPTD